MNILFLSLGEFNEMTAGSVHVDILKRLAHDHNMYLVCKCERRNHKSTSLLHESNISILRVKTGNIKKTNLLEKGISTILIESQFKNAIKQYYKDIKFDLVLYETPPITFASVVKFIKNRDNANTYLMLKDIFPQNAIDLGMMKTTGIKGFIYKYFRKKEKKLYAVSDKIGCMSQANVDYVLKHNPEINPDKVEICPNSIEVQDMRLINEEKLAIRQKYGIPTDKKVFVYGGNLGKPQGIPFIIDCLRKEKENDKAFFLIVGDGTEYGKLEAFVNEEKPTNVKLMKRLQKTDYDRMIAACDAGMIFLDHRFTIPNFPSRLLSYMQAGLPVLACTDPNTDVGQVINGGFGWWCESDSTEGFSECIINACSSDLLCKGNNSFKYLCENYSVENSYRVIMEAFDEDCCK